MKPMLLHISLPYNIENLRAEIEAVVAKLPAGSTPCMHTESTVSIYIPPGSLPEILGAKIKIPMDAFQNWWLIPIGGASGEQKLIGSSQRQGERVSRAGRRSAAA